jgi:hypothetical protein
MVRQGEAERKSIILNIHTGNISFCLFYFSFCGLYLKEWRNKP